MSVGSEVDIDLQDLARIFTHGDGADLVKCEPGDEAWADNAEDVLAALLAKGWLPPTFKDAIAREVKTAYRAEEDDDAFKALRRAGAIMGFDVVDADVSANVTLTSTSVIGKAA